MTGEPVPLVYAKWFGAPAFGVCYCDTSIVLRLEVAGRYGMWRV
jgi:hypothetical protein